MPLKFVLLPVQVGSLVQSSLAGPARELRLREALRYLTDAAGRQKTIASLAGAIRSQKLHHWR